MSVDYKNTLTLPQTAFPMRANLAEREPARLAHWETQKIYQQIIQKNQNKPKFILHDGPPFTNGAAHMGHLLNRVLKDIVVRYNAMTGHSTPFIPGWDCHGLPIEQKVMKELQVPGQKLEISPAQLRQKCQEFAQKNIELMTAQFGRLGLLADWSRAYRTMDPAYEAQELRAVAAFVEQGLIYRDRKPVIWTIPYRTALAEAEIEYHTHTSPAIYVAINRADDPNTSFVIWTTTPWTIPANVAVALHPRLDYVTVTTTAGQRYIVAASLAAKLIEVAGLTGATLGQTAKGQAYDGVALRHPFMAHASRVVMAEYVSAEDGTGCVHTAPGHGMEDYMTGRQYGLEIYSPLDDDGRYVDDGRIPASLVGLTTLEKNGKSTANEGVIELLKASGHLLAMVPHQHQYPFCWRSQTPIVYRAVPQWFVGLDRGAGQGQRAAVLRNIDEVAWVPPQGRNRIRGSVESRPDWCISRQRAWGLPIPAFSDAKGTRYIDAGVIRAVADKVAKEGSNIFYEQNAAQILTGIPLPAGWPAAADLKPETDTLDVWFDSASSSLAVLQQQPDLAWPADLYLEGSDQHRGWFQSSLWVSSVATGRAPYKKVLTHGFILDADKEKLSKSRGALPFTEMAQKYGVDTLRLWCSSQDYTGDIILSDEILANISTIYSTLRNTLRYQLANLNGFQASSQGVSAEEMLPIDRWIVAKSNELLAAVTAAYTDYDFARVYQLVLRYAQVHLSAVYHDCIKDRMYTCGPSSIERRSAQTAMDIVFGTLVRILAPILPFTADEAWAYRQTNSDYAPSSVHTQEWPTVSAYAAGESMTQDFDALIALRSMANEQLEALRKAKTIGKSTEAKLTFQAAEGSAEAKLLQTYLADLPELYIVSSVELRMGTGTTIVLATRADSHKCPRCWRYVATAPEQLCERCAAVLANI